ncbi:MAG: M1 family aminopeptidase, partial [Bacteroidota bacterium]
MNVRLKLSYWLWLSSMFFLLDCESVQQEMTIPTGIPQQLAVYRQEVIDSVQYDLTFSIPTEQQEGIAAELVLHFDLRSLERSILLDFQAAAGSVQSVVVNGQPSDTSVVNEHLALPSDILVVGANQVKIAFQAGDLSLNRKEEFLYTLLVPDRASTLFPCFDQPDLKAKFKLILEMPADWKAMANAPVQEQTQQGERQTLRFAETAPISTYLFAFTAGRFQSATRTLDGREMTMLYRESDEEKVANNIDQAFQLHAESLTWMTRYTGIPMPFEKFDFALIPGFQYGGMEHVGAIFYRESLIFLEDNPNESQLLRRASLIAHETAHMWFG